MPLLRGHPLGSLRALSPSVLCRVWYQLKSRNSKLLITMHFKLSVWVHSLGVIRIRMIMMYSTPLVGNHFKITDSLNPPWTWIPWITDLLYSIGMGFEFHHNISFPLSSILKFHAYCHETDTKPKPQSLGAPQSK